jgi:hypothetical protein
VTVAVGKAPAPATPCDAVKAEVSKYSGWNTQVMTAIAQAESHCRTEARGDTHLTYVKSGRVYGYSLSVLQVRILPGREHCDSNDLSTNVKCAYAIWQGQGYKAWSTYSDGKYKQYM